jgi:hypothetical protein
MRGLLHEGREERMTKALTAGLAQGLWQIGALAELPRDMHCDHGLSEAAEIGPGSSAPCVECRRVLEMIEALRNERPA